MTIHYAIRPALPAAHLFHVTVTIDDPDPEGQCFKLPAWIPGSYMVREFARHIVRLTAMAGEHDVSAVPVEKLDKHTWRCAPVAGPLTLAYEVYAWDLSVRTAHLDQTHGFFNGACVFLQPAGRTDAPCTVDILPPDPASLRTARDLRPASDLRTTSDDAAAPSWQVATGLTPVAPTRRLGFGTYQAADYDELIDCPVELGDFMLGRFTAAGVPHEIAITGHVPRLDMKRLTRDLALICETQIRFFEPRTAAAPFDRYTFLTLALGDGHGGLEHRNSTALICKRGDLAFVGMNDATEGYRAFLGLASHEYFHAWNVKRIKPAAFVPYDLTRENYTRLLWLFEGFTSYYDDLLLARCGLLTAPQYLETIAKVLTRVTQATARFKQSVAASSFDAWIKYYRQDENAPNSVVSYYQKGALIALALDLTIRRETDSRRALDDVMRRLWQTCRRAGANYAGVAEDAIGPIIDEVTGLKLAERLHDWTEGTRDIDFAALLAPFGVDCIRRPALDSPLFALLGIRTVTSDGECRIGQVFDASPAQTAGLSADDTLVAVDGLRIKSGNLDALLSRYNPGETVEVAAFRRDEMLRFAVRLASQPPQKYELILQPTPDPAVRRTRAAWLGRPNLPAKASSRKKR